MSVETVGFVCNFKFTLVSLKCGRLLWLFWDEKSFVFYLHVCFLEDSMKKKHPPSDIMEVMVSLYMNCSMERKNNELPEPIFLPQLHKLSPSEIGIFFFL